MKPALLTISFLLLVNVLFANKVHIQHSTTIVDEQALTIHGKFSSAINGRTFQKDALVSHKGYQYIAYYDASRRVCLSRRKLPGGKWETLRFMDYLFESNDAHNVVSMGICPLDGTIHLSFDHHAHPLKYRRSVINLANKPEQVKWSTSSFGPILSELEKGKPISITYPKFWQTPDGQLQFNYRQGGSGNGDRMLVDYNAQTGTWKNTRQIDSRKGTFEDELGQSTSRCSYPNGYDYDDEGKLHTTFVWRETPNSANHDLMYMYSEDKGYTWKNNSGKTIDGIPQLKSPGLKVQNIPRVLGLNNDHGQTIDSKGRVHTVLYHCTDESIRQAGSTPGKLKWGPAGAKRCHHYWRDTAKKWHHIELAVEPGNRPKIFADKQDNLIMVFAAQKNDKSQGVADGDLLILVATAKEKWKDWHIAHVLKGPFFNEMQGDFYRWKTEEVLSIMLQDVPSERRMPSALKVVDLTFNFE